MFTIEAEKKIIRLLLFMVPFAIVNSYMLNVALPSISKEFHTLPSTTSWLVTIAGIISALGSVIYGKLADLYGVKKIALFGVVFFFGGSLLCFFSPNFSLLLIGRIIQGIGISTIPSLAMTIPAKYIAEERRGNALGTLASAMVFGAIIGPVLGGLLTNLDWRYLFLFPFILLIAVPFIWKWMPNKTAKQKEKIDFLSLGLLMGSVISLMEAITFMKINLLIISIILFFLFVWRQRKVQNPFVPFTLFRRKAYVQGVLMGVINTAMNFGVFLITPLLLSQYFGFSGYEIMMHGTT
jgi:DHA2 family metal-tetracycline-proton antiporter-like MFS transporter